MAELTGRTYLVTGANTGIGRATALDLAARGGRVFVAGRSEAKTQPVVDELRAAHGAQAAEFLQLDLGSLSAVRASAEAFLARDEPLHVLINNAGVGGQRGATSDGFEIHFGVNHLGHFLFTDMLLDRLRASAPARIVVVSSQAHYQARGIDYDAVQRPTASVTGLGAYAVSKLCNVLHAQELARRLDGSGVTTYSLHPGAIASDIWRRIPYPFRLLTRLMKSVEEGAQTSLYCATSPELRDVTGRYYDNCREKAASSLATPDRAAELWQRSEDFVS
jgi:NAD(P)-dependent dehydrogenase (short-subunit alcohol dehydrogenase family)